MPLSLICHQRANPPSWTAAINTAATPFFTPFLLACALVIATPHSASAQPANPQATHSAIPLKPAIGQKHQPPVIQPFVEGRVKGTAKGTVSAGEFSLAGLDFYATEAEVIAILGSPKSRETQPNSFIDEVLYFGGISVAIAGNQVWDIIATSPKFCTPSGVCPGDSVDYAFNVLGPTDIVGQEAIYTSPMMGLCSINLGISGDIISQIKLACP